MTGDWQTFKGESGTEGSLKFAEPKQDKTEIFNEALKDSAKESQAEAVTKKARKKSAMAPAAETPAAAETPGDETPQGATEVAEAAEVKELDADKAEEKAGGEASTAKADPEPKA